jgi:tetratricopeptide (TPR) repeat protein
MTFAHRALEVAREPQHCCEAHAMAGDINLAMGRVSEACAAYRSSIELAALGAERARAWLGLATALRIVDRYDEALAALEHAERDSGTSDARRLAHVWTLRGNLRFPRGEFDLCLEAHQRALFFAEQAGSVEDIARARGGLGDAQYQRGRLRTAAREFSHCVELSERHGLTGLQLAYLPMVATTQAYNGDFSTALATCARAAAAARKVSDRRAELLAHSINASVELNRAEYESARASIDISHALAQELGARRFETEALALRGLAQLGLRDRPGARATLHQAAAMAREFCPTYCAPWAFAALALALDDDENQVRSLLTEGEQLLASGCVSHNYLEFYQYAIEVALRWDDLPRAVEYAAALETYTREEPLRWADVVIARARALAAAKIAGPTAADLLQAAIVAADEMQFHALVPALRHALEGTPRT